MEVGKLLYPDTHAPTSQGARRGIEVRVSTAFANGRKLHSACLTNNSGETLHLVLVRDTTLLVQGAALSGISPVDIVISESGQQPACLDFGSSGYPLEEGFCIMILKNFSGGNVDLATLTGTSVCAVAYS